MRSSAFDTIDDPADPAWSGHAPDVPTRRIWPWIVVAVVAIAVAALGVTRLGGEAGAGDERRGEAPTGNVKPSAVIPEAIEGVEETAPTADAPAVAAEPRIAGSGWAPLQATQEPWSSQWLEGDLIGVAPVFLKRLEAVARELDVRIEVVSGWRTTHEQNELYQRYRAGAGNLAAPPGYSNHEDGRAADVYVNGVALASVDGAEAVARRHGLHFPVGGEPWHAELVDG